MKVFKLSIRYVLALACSDVLISGWAVPKSDSIHCIGADAATGTSAAVIVDDTVLVHTTQLLPLNRRGELVGKDDVRAQSVQVIENLARVLEAGGSSLARVVKFNVCLADAASMSKVQQALALAFRGSRKPAVSFVASKITRADALVAIDAVANALPEGTAREVKWLRATDVYQLPGIQHAALLPAGPKLYSSGMADTNALPEATRKTLEKLVAALAQLGAKKSDIVQLKTFMEPMSDSEAVRKEIVNFFGGTAPPVVFVEWISPSPNPPIEIELIAAARGDFSKETETVSFLTPPGTTSTKVFSRVARVNHGKLVYISGLYGMKQGDAARQVREVFDSLSRILKQTGSDFEHLAKATYYISDDDAGNKLNDIRPQFYNPQRPPAASKAKVKAVAMPGKTVMLDMIAVTP
jgi:enamine deaminase RidA (YjgF/YER057c/UK114 family)